MSASLGLAWAIPEFPPALPDNEVHVWRAELRLPPECIADLHATLSADEAARAARFRFDVDRNDYTVSRAALRTILGAYLGKTAQELSFTYSLFGKPALVKTDSPDVRFNLSRSRGLALYAVTLRRTVGVDVEYVDVSVDDASIVERFFSPAEVAAWKALSANVRPEAFFNAWTRKEAFIKAIGEGLSMPLDSFDVTLVPGEPALITRPSPCSWLLTDLRPKENYAGALVVDGDEWRLRCYEWTAG